MKSKFFSFGQIRPDFIKYTGLIIIFFTSLSFMYAQATLSIQGILKKSNGIALEDGEYAMTFKLYAVDGNPAGILWEETIDNVELNGGIYSVVLGLENTLTVPFNEDYELGVSVGTSELVPRMKLTSAPYALSLRGQTNQFPSTGLVKADTIKVANGVSASGGEPSNNNVINKGYSFNSDNDTGLFSPQSGEASIYINNVEKVEINSDGLNLKADGGISYTTSNNSSFAGWRLADVDDLDDLNGWQLYGPPLSMQGTGWNQPSTGGAITFGSYGTYNNTVLEPNDNKYVFKKQFNIPGTWSQMKVKFRYFFVDSWDAGQYDTAFAGFASAVNGTDFNIGWSHFGNGLHYNTKFGVSLMNQINFAGSTSWPDYWLDVEMSGRRNGTNQSFWVFIGAALNELDESYSIGPIEIWVR